MITLLRTLTLPDGTRADLYVDGYGDRSIIPWDGEYALALHDSEGDADRINEILTTAR